MSSRIRQRSLRWAADPGMQMSMYQCFMASVLPRLPPQQLEGCADLMCDWQIETTQSHVPLPQFVQSLQASSQLASIAVFD